MTTLMNIGEAATAAGVSAKMIRHYEQIGLIPQADRTESGYRLYGEREVSVLRFVRQSRRLGFSVAQIAELIGLWSDTQRTSREVKALAQRHLADLEEKRREIEQMMDGLSVLVKACHGNDQPHCAILEQLSRGSSAQHQPQHKPQLKKSRTKPDEPGAGASSHIDLMAWMRGVHLHQGAH
ncbi:Cu(I)-responsive transcriptional regulator [Rhodoferax sp.]|uniref:Cu(I)-responsive transcriptional regulator n=2 Tax=Rhodoferax sp. TaxID=50421 RepID=UPI002ABAC2CD|nr:Cu(I)-responsive transcriptional regulator [Rhodoferax sp.]MDZ4207935.1 Cu(I)-responsive transcriptional regulator [Rhodoferax sp.]